MDETMAKLEEVVIKVTADFTEFHRQMRRVQRQFFWFRVRLWLHRNGPAYVIAAIVGATLGIAAEIVLRMVGW